MGQPRSATSAGGMWPMRANRPVRLALDLNEQNRMARIIFSDPPALGLKHIAGLAPLKQKVPRHRYRINGSEWNYYYNYPMEIVENFNSASGFQADRERHMPPTHGVAALLPCRDLDRGHRILRAPGIRYWRALLQ